MESNKICMTKGDSAYFEVNVLYANDEPYVITDSDNLTFSVKRKLSDDVYALQKIVSGTNLISLEPSDTADLSEGRYYYDVQLNTISGDVFTVIPCSYFYLKEGVTK